MLPLSVSWSSIVALLCTSKNVKRSYTAWATMGTKMFPPDIWQSGGGRGAKTTGQSIFKKLVPTLEKKSVITIVYRINMSNSYAGIHRILGALNLDNQDELFQNNNRDSCFTQAHRLQGSSSGYASDGLTIYSNPKFAP